MRMTSAIARLIERERVCRVLTAGRRGMRHLVPVCQVVAGGKISFASGNDGRKVLNLAENPRVAVTVDLYSEDWTHLRGVMVQGRARLIGRGTAFRRIRALLYRKYRSEEHTSELQSRLHLVCRLLLEKKKKKPTSA